MYIRRNLILFTGLILVCSGLTNCKTKKVDTEAANKPNVIVIYTDDLNYYQAACYGGNVSTPNIDRLAKEGVRFTQYYPCTSLCCPSRFTALTGYYPSRSLSLSDEFSTNDNVLVSFNTDIIEGEKTIAHLMKQQGYATGFTGKWHNWSKTEGFTLLHVPDFTDPESPQTKAIIEENYKRTKEHIKKTSGFDYVEAVYGNNFDWLPITRKLKHHNQHWITYNSLKFIEQNKDKPFFLYMSTTIPHSPQAIGSLRSDPRATPAGYLTEHLDCQPSYEDILKRAGKADLKSDGELNTWVTMAWLDDGVGAILKKLDELGLRENTLIIFASDNDSPGKMTCYQGKVPFIVNWKGHLKKSGVCDELVSNVDIVPTVLNACNIDVPGEVKLDGLSVLPLLQDSKPNWRNSLYMEVTYTRAVVTKDFKYVAVRFPKEIEAQITEANRKEFNQLGEHMKSGEKLPYRGKNFPGYFDDDQLFDLNTDSIEQNNLAALPEYKQTLEYMQEELKSYSKDLPYVFGEFKTK